MALTGDATWAATLAEAVGERDAADISLIFRPGMDTLGLVREALNLLRPEDRWKVTFSTYCTQLPPWVECAGDFCWKDLRKQPKPGRAGRGLIIDLGRPTPRPTRPGEASPLARDERPGTPLRLGADRPAPPASRVRRYLCHAPAKQGRAVTGAVVTTPEPPRRTAMLRSRLMTAGVCGLVMMAVGFLGYQILDWQSSRERKQMPAVAVATSSAVPRPSSQDWRAEPGSAGDPHDGTDANSDSASESRRNQVPRPRCVRDKPGSGDSGAAGMYATDFTPPPPRRTDDPAVEHAAKPPTAQAQEATFCGAAAACETHSTAETSGHRRNGLGGGNYPRTTDRAYLSRSTSATDAHADWRSPRRGAPLRGIRSPGRTRRRMALDGLVQERRHQGSWRVSAP